MRVFLAASAFAVATSAVAQGQVGVNELTVAPGTSVSQYPRGWNTLGGDHGRPSLRDQLPAAVKERLRQGLPPVDLTTPSAGDLQLQERRLQEEDAARRERERERERQNGGLAGRTLSDPDSTRKPPPANETEFERQRRKQREMVSAGQASPEDRAAEADRERERARIRAQEAAAAAAVRAAEKINTPASPAERGKSIRDAINADTKATLEMGKP